tara:strand:+ start:660 stop:1001 length:342 start_codon:yes stop_codon:yes gene_type:complete
MKGMNLKKIWIVLLSVIWLTGASSLLERNTYPQQTSDVEVTKPVELNSAEINAQNVLYFYAEHLNWLSLFLNITFDKSGYQVPPWPEFGVLNTYTQIISYQQQKSSLSLVSLT